MRFWSRWIVSHDETTGLPSPDDEIVSAFNVAVEENHKEVIQFLCRFELDTRFMSSEAQTRYEKGLF
jgi:hypothetical protein